MKRDVLALMGLALLVTGGLASCDDNDGGQTRFSVYLDNRYKEEVAATDTLDVNVGDSLTLYLKGEDVDAVRVVNNNGNLSVEQTETGVYLCRFLARGAEQVIFTGEGSLTVNFRVSGVSGQYIFSSTEIRLGGEISADAYTAITTELYTHPYKLAQSYQLTLNYDRTLSGTYSYNHSQVSTGTFYMLSEGSYVLYDDDDGQSYSLLLTDLGTTDD
ncbi:MAG: hypothetical protein LUC23_05405, partial [Prevotellaceae bacterium]|nr:hypothetical protein [Prevotellaceae bacterium]